MLITKICTSEVYKRRSPSEVQTCYSSNGFKEVLKQSKTKKKPKENISILSELVSQPRNHFSKLSITSKLL